MSKYAGIGSVLFALLSSVNGYDVHSCPALFMGEISSECFVDYDQGTSILRMTSNGLPNHYYDPARGAKEQVYQYDFPLRPEIVFRSAGGVQIDPISRLVGFATNGVPFRLPSNPDAKVFDAADGCLGLVDDTNGAYYYATMPPCIAARGPERAREQGKELYHDRISFDLNSVLDAFASDRAGFPSPIIGYALDGFPIYGPYDKGGSLHRDLDNCNGKVVDGSYGYYATPVYPYLVGCFGPGAIEDQFQTSPQLEYSLVEIDRAECPVGMFQSLRTGGCSLCPAGTFGASVGQASSLCSGICPKGYYCLPGSSSPTSNKIPAGRYGAEEGMGSAAGSGECKEGYFCPAGSTSPEAVPCGGARWFCPPGSADRVHVTDGYYTLPTSASHATARNDRQLQYHRTSQKICERGYYCMLGKKMPCTPGVYGSTPGLTNSTCTAECPVGHYCPLASPLPIECPPGTYGATTGLKNSSCSGSCLPGYYCPAASTSAAQEKCPAGRFGPSPALTTDACSLNCDNITGSCIDSVCAPGYYCPAASTSAMEAKCGGADRFCPYGSALPTPVDIGYYTVGHLSIPGSYQNNVDKLVRVAQVICEPGTYCIDGTKYPCPAGTFGATSGLNTPACSGPCDPGYYCPEQSTSARQRDCGGPHLFCPGGEGKPRKVAKGNYSIGITAMHLSGNVSYNISATASGNYYNIPAYHYEDRNVRGEEPSGYTIFHRGRGVLGEIGRDLSDIGAAANRVAQSICPPGTYCEGGIARLCPAGTYGHQYGEFKSACAGKCSPGHYCPAGSVFRMQIKCPAGRWGTEGMGTEFCEGECKAGYYCPTASTSPTQNECGGETVFCPQSSGKPQNVSNDYYATGGSVRTRTGQALCLAHTPPIGGKKINICPSTTMPLKGPAEWYDAFIEADEHERDVNEQGVELEWSEY